MDPGRTVEMPPRGADLSFLNGSTPSGSHPVSSGLPSAGAGGHDTPSRWLTFGTTPNGNVTPGTAFGSPFWASLSQSKTSPKTYSPSKELNPFELSFFPKADTLAGPGPSASAGAARRLSKDQGTDRDAAVKQEDIEEDQQGFLKAEGGNPLRTSLKRSLPEGSNGGGPSSSSGEDSGAVNGSLHASVPASFAPSWKRPKFDSYHDSSASSSELGLNGSSPAVGGPSPETGSPASSMVPTPNIQSAILPSRPGRKDSQPMDQMEAAKLGRSTQPGEIHVPAVSAYGARAPAAASTATAAIPGYQLTQNAPQPLPSVFGRSATSVVPPSATRPAFAYNGFSSNPNLGAPAAHLQGHLLPAGAPGLPTPGQAPMHPHVQHQVQNQPRPLHQAQAQPEPIILPAKTAAQVQQQMQQQGQQPMQASAQPTAAAVPGSAAPPASALIDGSAPQLKMQAIPYANGRAPSNQPASNKAKGGRTRGKAAEAAKADNDGKGAADVTQSRRAGSAAATSKKGTKKEDNRKASLAPVEPEADMEADGTNPDEDFGEGEEGEERKRKAFLERNRQAACRSRQKKKEWIGNLEAHAAHLQNQNQHLTSEIDQLRKEMFALRHTLSFHERCGCPNIGDWLAREGPGGAPDLRHPGHAHMQSANAQGIASLLSASGVPPPPPPHIQHLLPQHHSAQQVQVQPGPPAHLQQQQQQQRPAALVPSASTIASGSPEGSAPTPASMHSQAPTPAQSGPPAPARQPSEPGAAPVMVKTGSNPGNRAMAPPTSINLSTSSLRPQVPVLTPSSFAVDGASINRPGSAGARFGLSTPNFADLFGDSIGRFPGMSTPGAGPPTMSPALPNTFGLSLNDIPVRPASAPPTPSPAIDARLFAPNADYFSAKNLSHHHGGSTPNMFGDLLAGLNSNPHSLMA